MGAPVAGWCVKVGAQFSLETPPGTPAPASRKPLRHCQKAGKENSDESSGQGWSARPRKLASVLKSNTHSRAQGRVKKQELPDPISMGK